MGVAKCCAFLFCRNIRKKGSKELTLMSNWLVCLQAIMRSLYLGSTLNAYYLPGHVRFTISHGKGVSGAATPETSFYPL